ncbi:MAG: phosphonopyruvate decarboxylase, partial [Treponema sp.]|nr:phosphonopyruvate decarboxylase [Treponema sp.]
MGAFAAIGTKSPKNYLHIVLNNGAHDSVGGQPTIAPFIDLKTIAQSCGYINVFQIKTIEELSNVLSKSFNELTFIEVLVKKGSRNDLGRPKTSPIENKTSFMKYIKEQENI